MLLPSRGWLRGLRAASLGVAGFVLALAAHMAAGGSAPGPVVLILVAGLVGLGAVLLTERRLSPVRVGVVLTTMQVLLHEVFMWLATPTGCQMTSVNYPSGGPIGHGGGHAALVLCATGMAQQGMGQPSAFATTAMIGAHVAATAVMAALLAYGEQVLWFLAGWVHPPRWLPSGLPELPAVRVFPSGAPRVLRVQVACGGAGLRGPPRWGLFAIA